MSPGSVRESLPRLLPTRSRYGSIFRSGTSRAARGATTPVSCRNRLAVAERRESWACSQIFPTNLPANRITQRSRNPTSPEPAWNGAPGAALPAEVHSMRVPALSPLQPSPAEGEGVLPCITGRGAVPGRQTAGARRARRRYRGFTATISISADMPLWPLPSRTMSSWLARWRMSSAANASRSSGSVYMFSASGGPPVR